MRRLLFSLLLLAALPLAAARLPQSVTPDHYAITITPDLPTEKFSGQETIDVTLKEPVDTITLHSADIVMHDVVLASGSKMMNPTITYDVTNEMASLKFGQTIPPGKASLRIAFDGILQSQAARPLSEQNSEAQIRRHAVRADRRAPRVSLLRRAGDEGDVRHHARRR